MKKTYNVISKNVMKLSVMFCFTLFFLGMSTSVSAQLASSRAAAGSAAEADYSITLKADIGVSDELAMQILMEEFQDVREESRNDLTPVEEAENSARWTFLEKSLMILDSGRDAKTAVQMGHRQMAMQVANYKQNVQTVINADGIVREYLERLK